MKKIRLVMEFGHRGRTVIRDADDPDSVLFEATEEWADLIGGDDDVEAIYTTFNNSGVVLVNEPEIDEPEDPYDYFVDWFFQYYTGDPEDIDEDILRAVPQQELRDFLKGLSYADSRDFTSFEAEQQYDIWYAALSNGNRGYYADLNLNADDLYAMGLRHDTPDDEEIDDGEQ